LATSFAGDVSVENDPLLVNLTGRTVNGSGGVFTFNLVVPDAAGTGLVLRASFPGLLDGFSNPFDVIPAGELLAAGAWLTSPRSLFASPLGYSQSITR
jgi:hypothetical protein